MGLIVLEDFISITPVLLFWVFLFVLFLILFTRDKTKEARLLVIGASLKILSYLLLIPKSYVDIWGIDLSSGNIQSGKLVTWYGSFYIDWYNVFVQAVGVAGLILLLYAFWLKTINNNTVSLKTVK